MKKAVRVSSRYEGNALGRGLDDPVLHATAVIGGILLELPTRVARLRVLAYLQLALSESADNAPNPDNSLLRLVDGTPAGEATGTSGD